MGPRTSVGKSLVLAEKVSLDVMVNAVEKVRQRLLKATRALAEAKVNYAVAGGNAVAAWVSTVDEGAVRNTRDVDLMLNRADFDLAKGALESAGFVYRHVAKLDIFLDSEESSARDAVHIVFADEWMKEGEPFPNPGLDQVVQTPFFSILSLEALVKIKLTAYRDKDRTHLRDLIDVGLIDPSWVDQLPTPLDERLQFLLDHPE